VKDLAGRTDSFRSFLCYVCVRHDEKFVWGGRTEAKGLFLPKELLCASFLRLFVRGLESLLWRFLDGILSWGSGTEESSSFFLVWNELIVGQDWPFSGLGWETIVSLVWKAPNFALTLLGLLLLLVSGEPFFGLKIWGFSISPSSFENRYLFGCWGILKLRVLFLYGA